MKSIKNIIIDTTYPDRNGNVMLAESLIKNIGKVIPLRDNFDPRKAPLGKAKITKFEDNKLYADLELINPLTEEQKNMFVAPCYSIEGKTEKENSMIVNEATLRDVSLVGSHANENMPRIINVIKKEIK